MMGYTRAFFPKMMRDRVSAARAVVQRSRSLARHSDLEFLNEMDREAPGPLGSLRQVQRCGKRPLRRHLAGSGGSPGSPRRLGRAGDRRPTPEGRRSQDRFEPAATLVPGGRGPQPRRADQEEGRRAQGHRRLDHRRGPDSLEPPRVAGAAPRQRRSQGEAQLVWAIIGLSLAAIVVGLLATGLAQRTLQPIRVLTEERARASAAATSPCEVAPRSNDEVGPVQEFNAMAASLRERERQLLEQRELLLRSERLAAIGRVSAQITHEIRNPLSSIGLNAELLGDELRRGEVQDPEKQRSRGRGLLSAIAKEIDRLTEIAEQYLAFARPPRQGQDGVDLDDVVRRPDGLSPARASTRPAYRAARAGHESSARRRRRGPAAPGPAEPDPQRPRSDGPKGGRLTVRTRFGARPGRWEPRVSVEVTRRRPGRGAGGARRASSIPSSRPRNSGTGLGLALSRSIARGSRGHAVCESPARARGHLRAHACPRARPRSPRRCRKPRRAPCRQRLIRSASPCSSTEPATTTLGNRLRIVTRRAAPPPPALLVALRPRRLAPRDAGEQRRGPLPRAHVLSRLRATPEQRGHERGGGGRGRQPERLHQPRPRALLHAALPLRAGRGAGVLGDMVGRAAAHSRRSSWSGR